MREIDLCSDSDDEEPEEPDVGINRVHCWVLLRAGSRGVVEDLFIEPTTARVYKVKESPYLKVDLLWNHRNLFVNMQRCRAQDIHFEDLYNSRWYEYVLLPSEQQALIAARGVGVANDDGESDDGNPKLELEGAGSGGIGAHPLLTGPQEKIHYLDVPPSWTRGIVISHERYQNRYYQKEKVSYYLKCKADRFAPHSQVDGLVRRITWFKDIRRIKAIKIEELYEGRKDRLVRRLKFPMQGKTIESFAVGRPDALKSLEEVLNIQLMHLVFVSVLVFGWLLA